MKTILIFLLVVNGFILLPLMSTGGGRKSMKEVQKAYNLRVTGKTDEAKKILDNLLARDSTFAPAHYEMARLKHHMMLGKASNDFDKILAESENAVHYDPENVVFAYYNALASFFKTFINMQMEQGDVKAGIEKTCGKFEHVLSLKPDYYEAMMYLVEFYGLLPPEMGGDSTRAATYSQKLSEMSIYYGSKARATLAPENFDAVQFWENLLKDDPVNAELLTEAGRAYLYREDPVNAEKYFEQAVQINPAKNILTLDLARFHIYKVMANRELAGTELPIAKTYLKKFLNSKPMPIAPLRAYATGLMALTERFTGNETAAIKLQNDAKAIDPYYSTASGIPTLLLFDPPDQISHQYFSFFKPF